MINVINRKEWIMIVSLFIGLVGLEFLMASGAAMPWDTGVAAIRTSISGPVAMMVIVIAIVGAGGALIFAGGEMNGFMKSIVMVVLAGAFIMGATALVTSLGYTSGAVIL